MTPVEILRRAKAEIETHGWTQRDFECHGALSAVGAINVAARKVADYWSDRVVFLGEEDVVDARAAFAGSAGLSVFEDPDDEDDFDSYIDDEMLCDRIAGWNDARHRTKDEVLAAFDRAIALAESEVRP